MDRKKCSEVGQWREHMRRRRKPASPTFSQGAILACSLSAGPMGRNGGELSQPVARVGKRYELRAARPSRCEESLRC
jgi:hypothetical protein